ncbi:hypothetical protein [Caballeronia sp. NCTM5]|uniref:hypothetical protein n=1 Tax=Caballeronia sp. NCTM5 TaxID=2921755 RepID=UPI002027D515|nr:hypothetical protein [Caballeronia sp. NCTM5]
MQVGGVRARLPQIRRQRFGRTRHGTYAFGFAADHRETGAECLRARAGFRKFAMQAARLVIEPAGLLEQFHVGRKALRVRRCQHHVVVELLRGVRCDANAGLLAPERFEFLVEPNSLLFELEKLFAELQQLRRYKVIQRECRLDPIRFDGHCAPRFSCRK